MDKKQQEYQNSYIAEKYDRFTATFPAGMKEKYRALAKQKGESLNGLINRLLEKELARAESADQTE